MISKNKIFNFSLVGFLFGVFLNNYLGDFLSSLIILFLLFIFFLNYYIFFKKFLLYFIFVILFFVLGIFVSQNKLNHINYKQNLLEKYFNNSNHELEFEIVDKNKIQDFSDQYIVKLIKIDNYEIDKNILSIIDVPKNYKLEKGYIIYSKSKIKEINNFNYFDYRHYLLSKNIYFSSRLYFLDVLEKKKRNKFLKKIDDFRDLFLEKIYIIYPKQEAIFLGGILLGARESLPQELKTNFNNSGLTHFIAVSGFNITILIIFFSFIFKFFPVYFRVVGITVVIIVFTLLVGDTPPVLRASTMGLIGYFILNSGRKASVLTIILLTAFLMVIISPMILNYDISFHLSFLAVLGIVYTQDFFKKIFYFLPETLAIREAFVLTMSALSFSLPIMIFNFGQLSILAPFANVAVTWTIPIAMLLGFLSILAYFINPMFGHIIGYLDWVLLKWDILMVNFFGTREFALIKFDFGIYRNYLEILYFVILIFLIVYFRKKR